MSSGDAAPAGAPTWPDEIYEILKAQGVSLVLHVPDAGHKRLIERADTDPEVRCIALTTEMEGVPLLAGAHLGGEKGVLLMQSSGFGNCVNQFGWVKFAQFPLVILVSMRGEFGEGNPWQIPMGQAVEPVAKAMGMIVYRAERPEEVAEIVRAAFNNAYVANAQTVVVLAQRLIGAKAFG